MLRGSVQVFFLAWCALSWRVSMLSCYAFNNSSSSHDLTYPDCNGTTHFIADAYCDAENNNEGCHYDGGDCCEVSCVDTPPFFCGSNGFDCQNPEEENPTVHCRVGTLDIPPAASPCDSDTPRQLTVRTTADANSLADSILSCSGGIFDIEWEGKISVDRTLYAISGTVLNVVGVWNAAADGGASTQLFVVSNGSLNVANLQITNGAGVHGGAIFGEQQSQVNLTGVGFSSNVAQQFGGAIYLEHSSLVLADSSNFTNNVASHGGAIWIGRNSSLVHYVGSGGTYRFYNNSATEGGALHVSCGSNVRGSWTHSSSTSDYISSSQATSYDVVNGSARDLFGGEYSCTPDSTSAHRVKELTTSFVNNSVQSSGGAVYVDDASTLSWEGETLFEGNSAGFGGALFVGYGSYISGGTTTFSHNSARVEGGAIASAMAYSGALTSNFTTCGAVAFLNNTCGGSGGALSLLGALTLAWGHTGAKFLGNSADIYGGAIFATHVDDGLQFRHAQFTENRAQRGGAVFELACGSKTSKDIDGNLKSNPSYFYNCTFVGNTATANGGAIESTAGKDRVTEAIFDRNTAGVGGALSLFGTAELYNSSFVDNMSGENGGSAISNFGTISNMTGLIFSSNNFRCPLTDFLDFGEDADRFEVICQGCDRPCQNCVVEHNTSVPECTRLPDYTDGGGGATTIEGLEVDRGYWRPNNKSKAVLPCYNFAACLGGTTDDPEYCSKGYEGPYCSVCSEGYAATLAFRCTECSTGKRAMVGVTLAITLLAALAAAWHMMSIVKKTDTGRAATRLETILPVQSLKIVVVAWQIVTQFSSAVTLMFPESYQNFLSVAALANLDVAWLLSAGCIVEIDFHARLVVVTLVPLAAIALLGVTYAVAVRRNHASEDALRAVRNKHQSALVFVTFLVYSTVSSAVFRTFDCDQLDGDIYLRTDYRIDCDSPRHNAFKIYAGLMIMIYPVGIPVFYSMILFYENHMLADGLGHEAQPRYGLTSALRKPYRPSVFYYEVVECIRRVLLTRAVVSIYPDTTSQIVVSIVIAFAFALVFEGLRPYVSKWDSWVSRAGHIVVFLNMCVALSFRVADANENEGGHNGLLAVLVAAHAAMILSVLVETMALVFSLRNVEISIPISRGSSATSFRMPNGSWNLGFRSGETGGFQMVPLE